MTLSGHLKWLLISLAGGLATAIVVAMGLHYFLHTDLLQMFLIGTFVAISGTWTRGGNELWTRLSLWWRACLIVIAAAALFTCIAVAERHHPGALWMASVVTAAVGLICLLYWPFSRAMDALWSRFQRHR
jgi:peptidoglycan/LPS O-acetylase OafA/YrhL